MAAQKRKIVTHLSGRFLKARACLCMNMLEGRVCTVSHLVCGSEGLFSVESDYSLQPM